MKALLSSLSALIFIALALLVNASCYTIDQREQAIVTQFGKPIGDPITTPGLHFKTPFIQTVTTFPRIVLEWDGPAAEMQTKDKKNIVVDNFARWRIKDPLTFFKQLRDERTADSRLNDILGSETRVIVARHDFIEMVRSDKDRKADQQASATGTSATGVAAKISIADARLGIMPPISIGRQKLEAEILANAQPKVAAFGIELLDLRTKRVNYNIQVADSIHARMISEREQIAERFRSEGAGEAAKIEGNRERELKEIESEAYKKVQEIEGAADAKALEIYARAYNSTPEAAQLFEFTKAMDTLKKSMTPDTTLILTSDGDLLRYLKGADVKSTAPASASEPKGIPGLPSLLDVPTIK